MKTGIVLAGGSLKGNYNHTGFLLALKELGIKIDACIGTSAGSLTGGYICSGGTPEKLREIMVNITGKDYIDKISIWKLIWYAARKAKGFTGMLKGKALEKLIRREFPVQCFEEQPIPFYAHTVNLSRRREEIISKGELAPAIRASSTIPFVFQPVKINGEWYVDGGVVGYNGVEELAKRHPDLDCIIVNDFHKHNTDVNNSFLEKSWTPYHMIFRLLDSQAAEFDQLKYEVLEKYDVEVITIRPNIPYSVSLYKPSKELANKVIDCSIKETLRCLAKVDQVRKSMIRERTAR